jgi:ElaB/YqjD/DUF883 family membrane-anchored ribosome-binding protein
MKKFRSTHLFWAVYIGFLFVLWPQAAWTIDQFQDTESAKWKLMGVVASPLAWALSGVIEATIGIVTHRLNVYWLEMPKLYKSVTMKWKRFGYRWLNVYAVALFIAMSISAVANYTHVVQFTNSKLLVFGGSQSWAIGIYQILFGLALPGVSFVFARVLSTMQESEQEDDPALAKANASLKEANATIREKDAAIRQAQEAIRLTERKLEESEQRYRAVGDVVRYLFGTDMELRDRIRGVRMSFPKLSQNGVAQLLGCSTSTVNEALSGFVIEIPEMIEVQS